MKTITTSNWRPLRCALYMLLNAQLATVASIIVALWAMPGSARAQQLYVSQYGNNTVGEYDATTGAAIDANLITGLNYPGGLALSGNTLFVSNNTAGTVGE